MADSKVQAEGHHASSTARPAQSPLRARRPGMPPARDSSNSPAPNQVPRRRSSMISLGTESVNSFRSTTDDLLLPRVGKSGLEPPSESSLHSAPLFLAIIPAVAGLIFKNGSAVMTDVTLLALAAVLLNWSIRLPWDWYHAAQAVRTHDSISTEDYLPMESSQETIFEENTEDGEVKESDETPTLPTKASATEEQLSAASSLRIHEILALIACFVGPLAGAWLLHTIRSQLSRPSEGLVSNYNLTIFLLASEIRPLSHLVKLIQNRTLHLQRVVAKNPHLSDSTNVAGISQEEIAALAARVSAIEGTASGTGDTKNADTSSPIPSSAARENLILDVRRSLQPDIDALNRAVRRYEKRATLLSMQIDGRLSTLENRMQDTLALAAAAERSASGSKRGSAGVLLDWIASIIVLPLQAGAWAMTKALELPSRVLQWILRALKEVAEATLPKAWIQKLKGNRAQAGGKPKVRQREKEKVRVVKKAA